MKKRFKLLIAGAIIIALAVIGFFGYKYVKDTEFKGLPDLDLPGVSGIDMGSIETGDGDTDDPFAGQDRNPQFESHEGEMSSKSELIIVGDSTGGSSGDGELSPTITEIIQNIEDNDENAYFKVAGDWTNGMVSTTTENLTPAFDIFYASSYIGVDGSEIYAEECDPSINTIYSLREDVLRGFAFNMFVGCKCKEILPTEPVITEGLPNWWEHFEVPYREEDITINDFYQVLRYTDISTDMGDGVYVVIYDILNDRYDGYAYILMEDETILGVRAYTYDYEYNLPYIMELTSYGVKVIH